MSSGADDVSWPVPVYANRLKVVGMCLQIE